MFFPRYRHRNKNERKRTIFSSKWRKSGKKILCKSQDQTSQQTQSATIRDKKIAGEKRRNHGS